MTPDEDTALAVIDQLRAMPRFERDALQRALGFPLVQVGVVRATIWAAEPPAGPFQRVEFHDPLDPAPGKHRVPARVNLVLRRGLAITRTDVTARHPDGRLDRVMPHVGDGRESWVHDGPVGTMTVGYDGPTRRLAAVGFTRSE